MYAIFCLDSERYTPIAMHQELGELELKFKTGKKKHYPGKQYVCHEITFDTFEPNDKDKILINLGRKVW
jgi:hypothetical protein